MSDVRTRTRRATYGDVPVDREAFLRACEAKGATTVKDRAHLLGITEKMAYNYEYGHVAPGLFTARRLAGKLDVRVDDLWPAA